MSCSWQILQRANPHEYGLSPGLRPGTIYRPRSLPERGAEPASAGSAGVAPRRLPAARPAAPLGSAPAAAAAATAAASATLSRRSALRRNGRRGGALRARRLGLSLRARLLGSRLALRRRARGGFRPRALALGTILRRDTIPAGPLPPDTATFRPVAPGPVAARMIARRPGPALLRSRHLGSRRAAPWGAPCATADGSTWAAPSDRPPRPRPRRRFLPRPSPSGAAPRWGWAWWEPGTPGLDRSPARAPLLTLRPPTGLLELPLTPLFFLPLLLFGPAGRLADDLFRPPGGVDLVRFGPVLFREDGAEGDDDLATLGLGADRLDGALTGVWSSSAARGTQARSARTIRVKDLLLLVRLGALHREEEEIAVVVEVVSDHPEARHRLVHELRQDLKVLLSELPGLLHRHDPVPEHLRHRHSRWSSSARHGRAGSRRESSRSPPGAVSGRFRRARGSSGRALRA